MATSGDDANRGTVASPLGSLAAARNAAREFAGKQAVTVHIADGVYYLQDTLTFGPSDSGTARFPVTYLAENEGGAVLSGGMELALEWKPFMKGIYRSRTPANTVIDQLFVNGVCNHMARYPNYDPTKTTAAYQGYAADAFSKERATRWTNPEGGYIHAMHRNRWGGYHYRITGKRPNGEVEYVGGWQNNRRMGMHRDFRMVENIFEELDAPGEWFHDEASQTLYYFPESGVELAKARVEATRLRCLVEFQGTEAAPVRFITLRGLVVRHAARTFMETREQLLRSDWAIYRGGAFMLSGVEDISLLDTEFDQVGGNAIFVSGYGRRVKVEGCHLHDIGASGVCFVGDASSVRDPLFEYGKKNDLAKIDRTPGPKTNDYPADCVVADCLIHGIGRVERQPAGVQISMARGITVRDTSIYDCARAGINIGDGCWGDHLIERCDVFDTVLETHDHGSFNSWGRDRFWRSDRNTSQAAVDAEPELPFLDAVKTTTIRDSRWRCDHGWDIDLDDGSTNYDIYNNLMLHGGLKFREGFRRRAWNNITINNGFHPHVWFNDSGDEVFSNLFMAAHRGVRVPTEEARGERIDRNLFFMVDPNATQSFRPFGWDLESIHADPRFVDPDSADFRVDTASPALRIGFKNFPMDQFGVKKPSLKAIAKSPVIPSLLGAPNRNRREAPNHPTSVAGHYWLGAKLVNLRGEAYSAYGVSKEDGGVALEDVPKNSAAARLGLRKNDLLQKVNGHRVADKSEFLRRIAQTGDAPLNLSGLRDQQTVQFRSVESPYVQVQTAQNSSDLLSDRGKGWLEGGRVTATEGTSNQPVQTLVDGKLAKSYGPVFKNGIRSGAYKLDLSEEKRLTGIHSWSYNQNGNRGPQKVTLYGSRSESDPGWKLEDATRFIPLTSIDTTGIPSDEFTAASLQARTGEILGNFRWIVWQVKPVTRSEEHSSFQELAVEFLD